MFIIGKVFSVDGRTIKIAVNKNKNHSHIIFDGKTIKNVSVGSYVKILKGFTTIIGKVEGEYIEEERYYSREYKKEETRIKRVLQASLFGHYEGAAFKQGIKEMPLIDNECYVLDKDEFNELHQFARAGEDTISIGNLTEEPSQDIRMSINGLFASHLGIFGNTGSGKSNTLARLYGNLFETTENFPGFKSNATFFFIDFNGEYTKDAVLTESKKVIMLDTSKELADIGEDEKFRIPVASLEELEVLSVLLEATEKTQQPFLSRMLTNQFLKDPANFKKSVEVTLRSIILNGDHNIGVGVIVDFMHHLAFYVETSSKAAFDGLVSRLEAKLKQHSGNGSFYWERSATPYYDSNYHIYDTEIASAIAAVRFRMDDLSALQLRIVLSYYGQLASSMLNPEHIGPLLGRMRKRFRQLSKVISTDRTPYEENIIVLSLRNVNLEMKKTLPLMISKYLYDKQKSDLKNSVKKSKSLHLIIDEAHNILSTESQRESESWKDYRLETFEEIIKEGRKFAVFLTVASQRPYDISPTIISQLHNYFIHRLINENDIAAIRRAVAYLDKLSFESIPVLAVGSCFVAGLATDLPIKVDVARLPEINRPDSETIKLVDGWQTELVPMIPVI